MTTFATAPNHAAIPALAIRIRCGRTAARELALSGNRKAAPPSEVPLIRVKRILSVALVISRPACTAMDVPANRQAQ
jgi:hypothetical protein